MIKIYLIYISLLFIVFEVCSKPAFISQGDSYELDFSSREIDINVNTNSKFNLSFKDESWIYIKSIENEAFIKLIRESYNNGVVFTFQTFKKEGKIKLVFSYQNVKDSSEFNKIIILKIIKKFEVGIPHSGVGPNKDKNIGSVNSLELGRDSINGVTSKEIIARALNLSYINDYKGAIDLLNKYNFNDDKYILLKAEIYYKNRDYLKSYENYLKLKNRCFHSIVFNLIKLGIELNIKEEVLENARYLVEKNVDFSESIYLEIFEFLVTRGEHEFALNFSSLYFPKYINSSFSDKYSYLLGKLYESESKHKDFLKALYYYKLVIDNYPFSYYYERAKIRYLFLKRFF
ncbi:hypothetical protein QIA17_00745 [Borreliella californiensis]|uniref:Tetratricopeptide repeat domain protein n=1 Tax=Borreliella californiensis TaxID=373543 RepID=A0A7X0DPL2_9SPIR|nr:hypothetical protein [Borreliella californiensis]MBB6213318.1 hypothetical protein [Borreliella californiensis]WKC91367.1 hypothetical protein QIA17_00745 [Borreliella californiensis]WNY70121.1 hypothetical protein QIA39_00210 [Borreliella californiensis]